MTHPTDEILEAFDGDVEVADTTDRNVYVRTESGKFRIDKYALPSGYSIEGVQGKKGAVVFSLRTGTGQ